jgi:hypothetical protein
LRMNVPHKRGNTDAGAVFPPPWRAVRGQARGLVNVVARCVDPAMFFAVCDFAALYRAALCAARVEVRAAVSSSGGGIWGREATPLPPPEPGPGPRREGVALYHLISDQMIRDQSEGGVPCGSCGNRSVVSKERWARSVRPRLRQLPQADRRESVSPGRSVENTRGRSRDSSARRGSVSRRSVRGACPVGNRAKGAPVQG